MLSTFLRQPASSLRGILQRPRRGSSIGIFADLWRMDAEAPVSDAAPPELGWWARYSRWRQTSVSEAQHAETRLMAFLRTKLQAEDVQVGPHKEEYLHTLIGGSDDKVPVVIMPGYGAGSGFWFRNLDHIAERFKLYAVDWLGTGLSGRPPYCATSRQESEDFFLHSLEKWRQQQGLTSFVLVGHSLGGYLATRYALHYPEQVKHLVLVCPAGIPSKPDGWEHRFMADKWSMRSNLYRLARGMWENGYTPGSFIRALGPWGPGMIERYVKGRFSHHGDGLSPPEQEAFKDYMYHIIAGRGSGEFALRHLLAPGAWAHAPLGERFRDLQVPVTFIYGEHDWMNPAAALQVCQEVRQERPPSMPSDLHVEVIPDAGHFVFMDQPEQFNSAMDRLLRPYIAKEQQSAAAEGPVAHDKPTMHYAPYGPTVQIVGGEGEGVEMVADAKAAR